MEGGYREAGFGFETPIGAAAAVEVDAAAPSLEELGVEMPLQGADAVAGGGEAQAVERREGITIRGAGTVGLGRDNQAFRSTRIHRSQKTSREVAPECRCALASVHRGVFKRKTE